MSFTDSFFSFLTFEIFYAILSTIWKSMICYKRTFVGCCCLFWLSLIFMALRWAPQKTYTTFTHSFYSLVNFLTWTLWPKSKIQIENKTCTYSDRMKHFLSNVTLCVRKTLVKAILDISLKIDKNRTKRKRGIRSDSAKHFLSKGIYHSAKKEEM